MLFGDLLLSLLKKILHSRRPLVEVNVVYCVSFFYLILLILYILHHRVSHYEKKTKGKNVASGIEGEEDVQVQNEATPLAIQKPIV